MTISASGAFSSSTGTGTTTLTVVTGIVGAIRVVAANTTASQTISLNSISGGGVTTWKRGFLFQADTVCSDVWWGQVTSTSGTSLTFTWSASVSGAFTEYSSQMFTTTYTPISWNLDMSGMTYDQGTNTAIPLPTLQPQGGVAELYFGSAMLANTGSSGGTTGFTYASEAGGDIACYNTSVTAAVTPYVQQSASGYSHCVGLLFLDHVSRAPSVVVTNQSMRRSSLR